MDFPTIYNLYTSLILNQGSMIYNQHFCCLLIPAPTPKNDNRQSTLQTKCEFWLYTYILSGTARSLSPQTFRAKHGFVFSSYKDFDVNYYCIQTHKQKQMDRHPDTRHPNLLVHMQDETMISMKMGDFRREIPTRDLNVSWMLWHPKGPLRSSSFSL